MRTKCKLKNLTRIYTSERRMRGLEDDIKKDFRDTEQRKTVMKLPVS